MSTIAKFSSPPDAPPDTPIDEMAFCWWVGQAKPGEVVQYHRGFLVIDTDPQQSKLPLEARTALAATARRAWWAATQGLIHLVQVRNGPEDFSYIAIGRPRRQRHSRSVTDILMAEVA